MEAERLKKLCWCCKEDSGFVYPVCYVESPATLCAVAQALTPQLDGLGIELSVLASFPSRNPELGPSEHGADALSTRCR